MCSLRTGLADLDRDVVGVWAWMGPAPHWREGSGCMHCNPTLYLHRQQDSTTEGHIETGWEGQEKESFASGIKFSSRKKGKQTNTKMNF